MPTLRPARAGVIPLLRLLVLLFPGLGMSAGCEQAVGSAGEGAPAPVIGFDEVSHDFGVVTEGAPVRHLFKVKNRGSAPLEIKSVSASCGCTAAVTRDKVIKPGGSGEIDVSFDTRGRPGKNLKTVTVSSNDPKTPIATLTINVEVERLLGFEPIETYLSGQADQEVIAEAWLAGKLAAGVKLKVAKVDPPQPLLVALVDRKTEKGERQRGLRFQNAPKQAGSGTVRVVLNTGLRDPPQLVHLVRWSLQGNLEVPEAVYLDLEQAGTEERVIPVRSRRPDFRLTRVRVLKGPFRAELLAAPNSAQPSVKITSTLREPPPAPASGRLLLESNDPLQPRKEIALSLEARRPAAGAPSR